MSFKPPKPWTLTEKETISSYSSWQSNMLYHLSLNNEFSPFIADTFQWQRSTIANRGLADDAGDAADRKTAAQKNIQLERMLGIIAQFSPSLLRNDIIKKSLSLKWIWKRLRKHYSFSQSEVNFLKLCEIKREPEERYETLFQRIIAHLDDNLLTTDSDITHDGAAPTTNEEMTPTVERLAVYIWLTLIDSRLPAYIARVYAHDLQSKSLKDIQPRICDAMDSLLAEMVAQDDISVNYSRSTNQRRPRRFNNNNNTNNATSSTPNRTPASNKGQKQCILCKTAGRSYLGHDISSCWFISKFEKMDIVTAFQLNTEGEDHPEDDAPAAEEQAEIVSDHLLVQASPPVRRVQTAISPFFYAFYQHHIVKILVDTGATSSLINTSFARRVGLNIEPTTQGAKQLDKSLLHVSGEVHFSVTYGEFDLHVEGLINGSLDYDILAGIPFCEKNMIDVLCSRQLISINGTLIPYGSRPESIQHSVFRAESVILRNDRERVLFPGEYLEISSNELANYESDEVAIEPRTDSPLQGSWPSPTISRVIQGSIRIPNQSAEPIKINKCQHFAQIRRVTTSEILTSITQTPVLPAPSPKNQPATPYSSAVATDPDKLLPPEIRQKFHDLHIKWDNVFNPRFGRYNGASGPFMGHIRFGNVEPPSTKTKIPFYNQSNMQLLQREADKLEELGVLAKPEDLNIDVKFASPSFLRKKPSGAYRFVTSFTELGQYIRTLPVASTNSDKIIRELAKWKFAIKTDLTQSFFQIPISKSSMPYLATITPFKGLRVYTTPVMGMPGSSEILQELLSRIFGGEMTEGWILIIADDMYVCANTAEDLLVNWEVVLEKMNKNGLSLSAVKTFVCPLSFDVLGWKWSSGTISVTPHKITPLVSAEPPKTCSSMRSFIGAFKALSRCIPKYSSVISPLEDSIKGLTGSQRVEWTENLLEHFRLCKEALKTTRILTLPTPDDKLILTVDASPVNSGIGATLYICKDGKRLLSECFSMKLKTHHLNWEPCEMEALAIASAVQHFSPYIRESKHPLQILSDSRPCIQAFAKLRKGHFSASARVSTFLSTLSQHSIVMTHLKGANNTSSDYASRHPHTCVNASCQICKFVEDLADSVVLQLSVEDVMSGTARMPFLNKSAWLSAQHDSTALRRVHAHLTQGTRPSKKARHIRDVKRYLNICSLDNNGLIIVRKPDPFLHQRELIVVPNEILPGLLTALHIQFSHPTKHQLSKLFDRHFYAIASTKYIEEVVDACNQCNSLKALNRELFQQTSSPSPTRPGEQFASDVIRRQTQHIFVSRDIHTSYTTAAIVPNETANTLRSALLDSTSLVRLPACSVRVDNAPGFKPLKDDSVLNSYGLTLDFGRVKNINKNPVAERSNQELETELLRIDPSGSPVSPTSLQQAVKILNTRIRNRGLSAQEMLFCRDQNTGEQLNVHDANLSIEQETIRGENHLHSSRSKARGAPAAQNANVTRGDLVFIKSEGDKNKSRDTYLVMDIQNTMAILQKLNGTKFQSRRYEVPLTNVFHAIKPSRSDNSSKPTAPSDHTTYASSSSSDEEDEDEGEDIPPVPAPIATGATNIPAQLPRRTTRISNPPQRYGEWVS